MPEPTQTPPPPSRPPYPGSPIHPGSWSYAQPYPGRQPRSAWFWVATIVVCLSLTACIFGGLLWSALRTVGDDTVTTGSGSDMIAIIDIDGAILDADKIDSQLRKFADDDDVKAILLHINSPGGGAAASQEIFHEVLRVRQEKHKKVIASVESVGASGAYYIASACDRIYANDASVVGSIGVIMEWTNYGDLMHWVKLKSVVIHAGELKDAGDPTRDMTPQEAAYFQSLVDNMYTQFIGDVAQGRHLAPDRVRNLATGQVWTGQQSLQLGLIDKIGGYRVALIDTAHEVGISGEPSTVKTTSVKKGLAGLLSGEGEDLFPSPSKLLDQAPGFYFMWK